MRIADLETTRWNAATGEAEVRARIMPTTAQGPLTLWYRYAGLSAPPRDSGDAMAAAMLPAAMAVGEPCHVHAPLSPAATRGFGAAQTVLSEWYPDMRPVAVESTIDAPPDDDEDAPAADGGIACCFSGGVDSWFSLLRNIDRVTHLVLIRGFDVGLDNDPLWQASRERVVRVAEALGLRLVTCETNLRAVADRRHAEWGPPFDGDFWGERLHGAALASVALQIPDDIGTLIIPATHSRDQLKPWGSSPRLDPCWSSRKVRIAHDGHEADRMEKVRSIARSALALETLRVCHNDVTEANCGRCEKCVRTMAALHLCGALRNALAFPRTDALRRLQRLEVPRHLTHHYHSLHEEAKAVGDEQTARAVAAILGLRFSPERTAAEIVRGVRRRWRHARGTVPGRRANTSRSSTPEGLRDNASSL